MHVSRQAKFSGYPYRTALHPRRNFSSGNRTRFLSHRRIPEPEPVRAYQTLPALRLFQRHGLLCLASPPPPPLPIPGCPALLPGFLQASLGWATLPHWTTPSTHLCHSGIGVLNYHNPIDNSGWGSKCPFSFGAQESSVSFNQQRFCSDSL